MENIEIKMQNPQFLMLVKENKCVFNKLNFAIKTFIKPHSFRGKLKT